MTSGIVSGLSSGIVSGILSGMDTAAKTQENRVRRMAERQGLQLQRSRRRDPRARDYGRYRIVDLATNSVVAGGQAADYSLDLEDAERYLTSDS
jgi:hypothetical protein